MNNLFLFALFVSIIALAICVFRKLLSIDLILYSTVIQYSIIIFSFFIFILAQSLAIKYNFFELFNCVFLLYMWLYFIFSCYGIYKREAELRLLSPIKFSFVPSYFYKLIKRSIKIRYLVLQELFLSFSLKDCIFIGLIFLLSYAGLRILRSLLVYEVIVTFGINLITAKYLTALITFVSEIVYIIINVSEKAINLCKSVIIEEINSVINEISKIYGNEENYDYIRVNEIQERKAEEVVELEKLGATVLQMKRIYNTIGKRHPYIKYRDSKIEVSEIIVPSARIIPSQIEYDQMTSKERQEAGLESKSGQELFNIKTGFPKFCVSSTGKEVCEFEVSGSYVDSENGYKPFNNHLDVDIIKSNLALNEVVSQFTDFHNNRVQVQQALKYEKLHEQFLNQEKTKYWVKGQYKMDAGSLYNYNKYKDQTAIAKYFDVTREFKLNVNNNISPQTQFLFNCEVPLNIQQFLYESSIFLTLKDYATNFTVKMLPTKGLRNEVDVKVINNSTNDEISLQLKTLTTTKNQYLEPDKKIDRYQDNTELLVVSSTGGQVVYNLNRKGESQDKIQAFFNIANISNLKKEIEVARRRLYIPDIKYNTERTANLRETVHAELKNKATINQNTPNEHCIKPSSIKNNISNNFNDVD